MDTARLRLLGWRANVARMRTLVCVWAFLLCGAQAVGAEKAEMQGRRQRAASAFRDGILLIHAKSALDLTGDGFRQDAAFYYFTALENTLAALLAIDGRTGESWLFLPTHQPYYKRVEPEVSPGADAAKRLGIEHVVDWTELEGFLAQRANSASPLYYIDSAREELPANVSGGTAPDAPLWLISIAKKWPAFQPKPAGDRVSDLMAVQSPSETSELRAAARATVPAVLAGMRAIRPGASQRSVEAAVENACWQQGAHGTSFWPWAMAGPNGVFPAPFMAGIRYNHLDAVMRPGDLVRLDVGCEWNHYQGDLGRTVPVSGRYSEEQRETWNIFVAAYQAGVKALREGITVDQVFDVWRKELMLHRESAKSDMTKSAIDSWSKRENIRFWQLHTINLDAGRIEVPLAAGTTIAFEPIASIDHQGFYLEDMFLITKNGAELLTPGVPYAAEEIEAAMR